MSSIGQALPSLVFPESTDFLQSTRKSKKVSFTYLLVIVYIYGGVSVFLWLLSKTVLNPLFQQLTYDRRFYNSKAFDLVCELNARLSSVVSVIPSIRESLGGQKYSDAQTQTDPARVTSSSSSNPAYTTYVDAAVSTTPSQSKSVGFVSDLTPAEAAVARTQKMCEKMDGLTSSLKKMRDESTISQVSTLRYSADRLKGLVDTLYSGLDLERTPGTKPRTEIVSDVKKEIRSFKGSFLSARSFPGVHR